MKDKILVQETKKMESLEINYEADEKQFRKIWFGYFKKGIPNLIIFWVASVIACFLILLFSREFLISGLSLFLIFTISAGLTLLNYQNFIRAARENFAELLPEDRKIKMVFQRNSDGFDTFYGKNFSHTSWKSIKSVAEFDDCFVFTRAGYIFYIPKSAFLNDAETNFFRSIISKISSTQKNLE